MKLHAARAVLAFLAFAPLAAHAGPGAFRFATATQSVNESAGQAVIAVERVGGADGRVSVRYSSKDGSARLGFDYAPVTGVLEWEPGDTAPKTFVVPLVNDSAVEPTRTFTYQLNFWVRATGVIAPSTHTVTLVDDDAPGQLQFEQVSQTVAEGAGVAVVRVLRVGGASGPVSVRYSSKDGQARLVKDYTPVTGVLAWEDGDAAPKSFSIPIADDDAVEPDLPFTYQLTLWTGTTVAGSTTHTITIADDDGLPDGDGDGVADASDNCPAAANLGQADADRDGTGDACDAAIACPPVGDTVIAEWDGTADAQVTLLEGMLDADADLALFKVPAGCGVTRARVEISWGNPVEDLDLYVTGDNQASNNDGATSLTSAEKVDVLNPAGDYEAEVVSYLTAGTAYHGKVTLTRESGGNNEGGSLECAAAFAGIGASVATAAIDPAMPWGEGARLVLSFPTRAERDAAARHLLDGALLSDAQKAGLTGFRHLPMLVVPAGVVTTRTVHALRDDLTTFRLVSIWSGEHAVVSHLRESVPLIGVTQARAEFATAGLPLTGQGIGVAVIDTGLDTAQGDFPAERIKQNVRIVGDPIASEFASIFIPGVPQLWTAVPAPVSSEWTSNGHGTHLAGTIVGSGAQSDGEFTGVAPGVDLVAVAVETGSYLYALAGIDYVLGIRADHNIRVTNHSYGPPTGTDPVSGDPWRFNATDPESLARKALYDAGIISVQSAGNAGSGNDTMGPQAQNPCVITVASGKKDGTLSGFSSRGTADGSIAPDITAPGEDIIAARATNAVVSPALGGNPLPYSGNPFYIPMSGTSMATPHVAGAIAILLEAQPALNFQAVLDVIQETARPMAGYDAHEVGAGYLDVFAALADPRVLDRDVNRDSDGDTVPDAADNCPSVANPGQEDADGDGTGDACDGPAESACATPGVTMATDAAGDDTPPLPTAADGSGDFLSVHVAEPDGAFGKLVFTLRMATLPEALPPNVIWRVRFVNPHGTWHLEMQTDTLSAPSFIYGDYTVTPTSEVSNQIGDLDPASTYDPATGEIRLVIAKASVGAPAVGTTMSQVIGQTFQVVPGSVGGTGGGSLQPIDDTGPGEYTLRTEDACAVPDPDRDGDGILNGADNCPTVANAGQANFDGDAGGDACDADDDNDGTADVVDAFPFDAAESADADQDGIGNNADGDDDGDGVADADDRCPLDPLDDCTTGGGGARVVVAVIDSALNPYHSSYYDSAGSVTPALLAELGVDAAHQLQLTRTGHMAADLAADAALWAGVRKGELYWFKGTNVLAISFAGDDGDTPPKPFPPLQPVWYPPLADGSDDPRSKNPHGTGTSSAVRLANPDAVILFVETDGNLGNDEAHEYVKNLPAVDIISTSYGISLNGVGVLPATRSFHVMYDAVVGNGKLHFTSAGNNPGVTPISAGAGPWWSVAVGGLEVDKPPLLSSPSTGQQVMSGNFPDFVADYTQRLPYCMGGATYDANGIYGAGTIDCEDMENDNTPGTSFSTPTAAGVASKVLLEARARIGHVGGITSVGGVPVMATGGGKTVTNWFLRRALEAAALVPPVDSYSPQGYVTWEVASLPVNPVAPWLQIGWGWLTADPDLLVVPFALDHLGVEADWGHTKGPGFCEYQTELILERKLYWDFIAPTLPALVSAGDQVEHTGDDPFIYCASLNPTHPAGNDPGGQ